MRTPARQGGIVLVLAAVSLLVLLAMGAMALDVGHLILNKGKLQNMVDAAALSAAKTLDMGGIRRWPPRRPSPCSTPIWPSRASAT